jgi:NAD(P)-dependent dehydrogenase (short-subunit alcohol dehydrogenase family)
MTASASGRSRSCVCTTVQKRRRSRRSASTTQPLHRIGDTRDIANAAVYLASERAAQVTGILIPVDGGTTAGPPPIKWDDIKAGPTADDPPVRRGP